MNSSASSELPILGGGPGGYEAALAGAQLGAEVTLVERDGVGGSAVLTDVVPSKTLIATAEATNAHRRGRRPRRAVLHPRRDRPRRCAPRSRSTSRPSTPGCCASRASSPRT